MSSVIVGAKVVTIPVQTEVSIQLDFPSSYKVTRWLVCYRQLLETESVRYGHRANQRGGHRLKTTIRHDNFSLHYSRASAMAKLRAKFLW
ncbi:hypothetical protein F443_07620 [Phytophthora nicotianae P1569]|uniref:Uncharacterized protein n=1 Tax=Phytophthora nicotianae P1569 TaxID=1317065 RepID=V9FC30_PHYNI|nr:hypothetical protein F443_07620 [Phytophthora nicotianae P1569]